MNQSEFLAIAWCNLLKKSRVQGEIGFGLLLIGWYIGARLLANHKA